MLYLWKLSIEWVLDYPRSALIADVAIAVLMVFAVGLLIAYKATPRKP